MTSVLYSSPDSSNLFIRARLVDNKIHVRWSPINPTLWSLGNTHGYILERYTIMKNTKLVSFKSVTKLILPKPLDDWQKIVEEKQNRAVVAQAIYGEDFKTEMGNPNDEVSRIIQKSTEQEQRFTSSLLFLESDFILSTYAGLGFIDSNVTKDETYLYRVYIPNIPKSDTAVFYLDPQETYPLPQPTSLQALFKSGQITLSWDFEKWLPFYSMYNIERSKDGKTYTRLNELPYTQGIQEGQNGQFIFYIDSLPQNYTNYYYRVKGISMFGEESPPSEPTVVSGYVDVAANAQITKINYLANNDVEVNWTFPPEKIPLIKGFYIMGGDNDRELKDTLSPFIPVTESTFKLKNVQKNSFYLSIYAVAKEGLGTMGFPELIQLEDSTPPPPPDGLKYKIDSLGVVKLTWAKNPAKDLSGYRVYFANNISDEFVELTQTNIDTTFFQDTIDLQVATPYVYYQVQALDLRYNRSKLSEPLQVKKPDKIAPIGALLGKVDAENSQITLQIIKSYSPDAKKITLFKREKGKDTWQILTTFRNLDTVYKDKAIKKELIYEYTLMTLDSAGNKSIYAPIANAKVIDDGIKPKIEKFKGKADSDSRYIEMSWVEKNLEKVVSFRLYRGTTTSPLALYEVMDDVNIKLFYDKKVTLGKTYKYYIQSVYKDGSMSEPSNILEIKYE